MPPSDDVLPMLARDTFAAIIRERGGYPPANPPMMKWERLSEADRLAWRAVVDVIREKINAAE